MTIMVDTVRHNKTATDMYVATIADLSKRLEKKEVAYSELETELINEKQLVLTLKKRITELLVQ